MADEQRLTPGTIGLRRTLPIARCLRTRGLEVREPARFSRSAIDERRRDRTAKLSVNYPPACTLSEDIRVDGATAHLIGIRTLGAHQLDGVCSSLSSVANASLQS
jgi:hypothetical protein